MLHDGVDSLAYMRYELERINRAQTGSEVDRFTEGRYRQFARHLGRGFSYDNFAGRSGVPRQIDEKRVS